MDNRKVAYILLSIGFIMIVSGGFASFILGIKDDRTETFNRMGDVTDTFEVFSTNTSVFEQYRDELYNQVLGNLYYDNMYKNDYTIKEKLSNYENLVDQLEKNTNELNHLCNDVYYPSGEVNSKCVNYKSIYEQVVNYFVSDIKIYNDNVKKYNAYQTSKGTNYLIDDYKTSKQYIDYNGDKKFDGKEE